MSYRISYVKIDAVAVIADTFHQMLAPPQYPAARAMKMERQMLIRQANPPLPIRITFPVFAVPFSTFALLLPPISPETGFFFVRIRINDKLDEMEEFLLKMQNFEGPLDLLLTLVEKRKLHVSDVSLAQVTDEYISFVRAGQNISIENMANFILVASTLILIKSYSLISTLTITDEEKADITDLENRLKLYERIRELAVHVKEMFGHNPIFAREVTKNIEPVFAPSAELTLPGLRAAMDSVIAALPKKEALPKVVVKKVMSLEQAIGSLTERIQRAFKMRFSDYVKEGKQEKVNVIVSFLGMLELVKQGIIDVKQDLHFSDIEMESSSIGTPRYQP